MTRLLLASGLAAGICLSAACGHPSSAAAPIPTTTSAEITAGDLETRLRIFADDSMQGRRSGTEGNKKGTDYIAAEARRIGLEPAGENGGWFQTVPMVNREISKETALEVNDTSYSPWSDFIPRDQGVGARPVDGAQAVFGGVVGDSTELCSRDQAAGKLVVVAVGLDSTGKPSGTVNRAAMTALFPTAAGIAVATLDAISPTDQVGLRQGSARLALPDSQPATPAFMYVSSRLARALMGGETLAEARVGDPGRTVHGVVAFSEAAPAFPARNVVAVLPGIDPTLRGEYVAIGAHNDHEGIAPQAVDHDSLRAFNAVMRPRGANDPSGLEHTAGQQQRIATILDSLRKVHKPRQDSILNGADDDGSGTVSVLEIAEKMAKGSDRPKRSVLFVWHTGEELGLLGSDWFTRHPTVPRDSIVGQLNIDMVGRGDAADIAGGGPGYLQMIGSRRLSTELGGLVERVNEEGTFGFDFDYTYDADGHPDNYYCRSDHYMYARFGIPIAFFSTGAHRDYHQVTDEPQYIDYAKMARVASLVEATALAVANLDHRVVVNGPKPNPWAVCKQ